MPQKGVVEPKCVNDPLFSVTEEEAERLIGLKVAKYADTPITATVNTAISKNISIEAKEPITSGESKEPTPAVESHSVKERDTDSNEGSDEDTADDGISEYSIDSKVDVLRKIGKSIGISFKVGTSKADMVAKLDEYFENDKAPVTSAEDPVV
jgi:hypothetical protein